MNRRKSLKLLGGSVAGVAGLVFADWKWQIIDQLTHKGFFTYKEAQTLSMIADTFIPAGIPPILPSTEAKPIGALSTGTDEYLKKVFEHCYEKEDQEAIKIQLIALEERGFLSAEKQVREEMLSTLSKSEKEEEKEFFKVMRSETITGFTTVKEVMVEYRNYQVAPGFYHGCVDVTQKA